MNANTEEIPLTVESALNELREMFPWQVQALKVYQACGRLDAEIMIDGVVRGLSCNSRDGLTEAMAQVRAWKESQSQ